LQLLPVCLFGTSIAKAALPTLSRQADTPAKFKKTLFGALNQVAFLILPIATVLIVLRIPIVRLIFGTDIFSWEATVQTGMVVSAFAFGVFFQAASSLLARGFYALHDTKTPVIVSIITITLNIIVDFILIREFGLPVWGLAAAFSLGAFFQATALFFLINKKIGDSIGLGGTIPIIKSAVASLGSGLVMYFILKIFDKSVWIKRLSFLGKIEGVRNIVFEKFVVDTRYTVNLIILTLFVIFVGAAVYLGISYVLKSKELGYFLSIIRKTVIGRKVGAIPAKETEPVAPTPTEMES
jgi:putative peptidoglycan lipid II flippase